MNSTSNDLGHPTSVLVSGAGISGLTTSYWLARYGFEVTVVELAPGPRPGGHAIDVRGPALAVAEQMGLDTTLRERSTNLTGMTVVDPTGQEIFRSDQATLTGGQLDSPDIEIMRDDLCEVLHDAVNDQVEFLFDDSITSLTQDDTGVDVTFTHAAPRRFDLVIGADGVGSAVRRITFGPDEQFLRVLGDQHIAVFSMPNFLGLERWEVLCQQEEPAIGALVMGLHKDAPATAYVGFTAPEGLDHTPRDITAQKRLVADRLANGGWVIPQLVHHMMDASDFHFYRLSQIRLDHWSRGRIALVGDAGYAVSLSTGQATTVAMVGAYVLAGELAAHRDDPPKGMAAYEDELRHYATRNQDIALEQESKPQGSPGNESPDPNETTNDLPNFGDLTLPFPLRNYQHLTQTP